MFEAVIFDWDGTLADTIPVILYAFQTVLKSVGCEITDSFLIKKIGIGARNMFEDALNHSVVPFDEQTLDQLMYEKNKIHIELSKEVALLEGAQDLLRSLRTRVKVALATMSNRKVIGKMLRQNNIRDYFDFVITADEIENPKPDPEIFLKCAWKLGVAPKKCVVVEDSIFGVIAAKKAGMKCIAVPTGAYSKETLARHEPDLIVDSLNEKGRILKFVFDGYPEQ